MSPISDAARTAALDLTDALAGIAQAFPDGGTLAFTWPWGAHTPMPAFTLTPSNTSAHTQVAAAAHARDPNLLTALQTWAPHVPLLWNLQSCGLDVAPNLAPPSLLMQWEPGQKGHSLLVFIPANTANAMHTLTVNRAIHIRVGKQGLEAQRLFSLLAIVQGPLAPWYSKEKGKEVHFIAGEDRTSALVMNRLIRAGTTVVRRQKIGLSDPTTALLARLHPYSPAEDLDHGLWA